MSVKHGLLALLERGPMHGYQLRVAFEESTGGTWPLNAGQVYPGVDVATVVQTQRTAIMRALQELTRLKAAAATPADLPWRLVLDAMVFQAEAEVRWLDPARPAWSTTRRPPSSNCATSTGCTAAGPPRCTRGAGSP